MGDIDGSPEGVAQVLVGMVEESVLGRRLSLDDLVGWETMGDFIVSKHKKRYFTDVRHGVIAACEGPLKTMTKALALGYLWLIGLDNYPGDPKVDHAKCRESEDERESVLCKLREGPSEFAYLKGNQEGNAAYKLFRRSKGYRESHQIQS